MFDAGQTDIEQLVQVGVVVTAIENVTAVIENIVLMMGDRVRRVTLPAPVLWTLEHEIVGGRGPVNASVSLNQFLIPPPYVLGDSGDDDAILRRCLVLVIPAI